MFIVTHLDSGQVFYHYVLIKSLSGVPLDCRVINSHLCPECFDLKDYLKENGLFTEDATVDYHLFCEVDLC